MYKEALKVFKSAEELWCEPETELLTDAREMADDIAIEEPHIETEVCMCCGLKTPPELLRNWDDGSMMGNRKWVDKACFIYLTIEWWLNEEERREDYRNDPL